MRTSDVNGLRARAAQARAALEDLAADLPYAGSAAREALTAGIEFERWLLESCRVVWEAREA